jgi:hypothetical protein
VWLKQAVANFACYDLFASACNLSLDK